MNNFGTGNNLFCRWKLGLRVLVKVAFKTEKRVTSGKKSIIVVNDDRFSFLAIGHNDRFFSFVTDCPSFHLLQFKSYLHYNLPLPTLFNLSQKLGASIESLSLILTKVTDFAVPELFINTLIFSSLLSHPMQIKCFCT